MASYYFAASGLTSNNGTTSSTPKPLNDATFGALTLASGDQVLLRAGDQFTLPGGFSATVPFTISTYGSTERAKVYVPDASAITMYNMGGVEVSNIDFRGRGTNFNQTGFLGYADTVGQTYPAPKATNCSFRKFYYGAWFGKSGAGSTSTWTGLRFTDSDFSENHSDGFLSNSDAPTNWILLDPQFVRCTFNDNYGDPLITAGASGSGMVVGGANGGFADQCVALRNGGNDGTIPGGPFGLWMWNSNNFTIRRSITAYQQRGPQAGGDGGGFDIDINCTNCTLEYNLSYECEGTGILLYAAFATTSSGNVIRHNVSINDNTSAPTSNYGGIHIGGQLTNCSIYNNTIVTSNPAAPNFNMVAGGTYNNVKVANNLFVHLGNGTNVRATAAYTSAQLLFQGNLYWRPAGTARIDWNSVIYTTLAAWRAVATNQEMVSGSPSGVVADPRLSWTYLVNPADLETADATVLASGSPAGQASTPLATLSITGGGTRDIGNETLRNPTSIGAQQIPLLSLNTAQNPNLAQILVNTEEGLVDYVTDKGGGSTATYSGKKKIALKALKNAAGQAYVTES